MNITTPYIIGLLEIFNLTGQLVYSEKIVSNITSLNLSNLNNGEYIIKVINTEGKEKLCDLSLCETDTGVQIKRIIIHK